MDDALSMWTEEDLQKACKVGFVIGGGLIGGAFGGLASSATAGAAAPLAVPAAAAYGAALGLGAALLVCPRIDKRKVERFLSGQPVTAADAGQLLSALAHVSGVRSKADVAVLGAAVQAAYRIRPGTANPQAGRTQHPVAAAQTILSHRRISLV